MLKSIGVHLKVKDFKKSHTFYQGLGFTKVFEYGPDKKVKEDYSGATFQLGAAKLEIADGHRAVKPAVFQEKVSSSKISLMIEVDSLAKLIKKAEALNLTPVVPVRHYYWGKLEVVYRDPDGVILVFTEPFNEKAAKLLQADKSFAISSVSS